MQTNGTISPCIVTSNENEYGEITSSAEMWGNAIRCSVVTNADNRIGKYEDGEFRMSAYSVIIEVDTPYYSALATKNNDIVVTTDWDALVMQTKTFNFERVRLTKHDESLGEFRVQQYEIFPRMGRIILRVV